MSLLTMIRNIMLLVPGLAPEEVKSLLNSAYLTLSREEWNYLLISYTIPTSSIYSTGTISISSDGVVTGTGTSFTSSMVGSFLRCYYSDAFFTISSYTNTTTLTLSDWTGETVTDESYSIFKTIYTLPSTFSTLHDVIYQCPLEKRSQSIFNSYDPYRSASASAPLYWAHAGFDSSGNLQFEVYPVPSDIVPLRCYGRRKITLLSSDSDTPYLPEDLIEAKTAYDALLLKLSRDPSGAWKDLLPQFRERYLDTYDHVRSEDRYRGDFPDKVKDRFSTQTLVTPSDSFWYNHDDL